MMIKSNHYCFHVQENSFAHNNIDYVIKSQEDSYSKITQLLNYKGSLLIHYHFTDTPEECGNQFNYFLQKENCETIPSFKTNAFAWYPDIIYATFNSSITAIGCHEDTHLIAYDCFKRLSSRFLVEGIAVAMDEYWQGKNLHKWAKYIYNNEIIVSLIDLVKDDQFDKHSDMITYPLAGSFCLWYIQSKGIENFKKIYIESDQSVRTNNLIKEHEEYKNMIKDTYISDKECIDFQRIISNSVLS